MSSNGENDLLDLSNVPFLVNFSYRSVLILLYWVAMYIIFVEVTLFKSTPFFSTTLPTFESVTEVEALLVPTQFSFCKMMPIPVLVPTTLMVYSWKPMV